MECGCKVENMLTPEEFWLRELRATSLPSEEETSSKSGSVSAEHHKAPLRTKEWPVYVELTNGKIFGCDLIVSATGVVPNTSAFVGSGLEVGNLCTSCMQCLNVYANFI